MLNRLRRIELLEAAGVIFGAVHSSSAKDDVAEATEGTDGFDVDCDMDVSCSSDELEVIGLG